MNLRPYRRPLVLFGPTASGKTALAIELAKRLDGVIVNADSLQVYAACPTLTARPDADEMAAADHRLYGFLVETAKMDVAHWLHLAKAQVQAIEGEGRLPIFCGGTGFYLQALAQGLSPIPPLTTETLGAADRRLEFLGLEGFELEVFGADPELRQQFEAGDRQRLLRAWSVWQQTGRPLSYWQAAPKEGGLGQLHTFALLPARAALYERIDHRFAKMIEQGALGQVAGVAQAYLDQGPGRRLDPRELPLAQAIGFRELWAVHQGRMTLGAAQDAARQASRNYAKRQMTWARNQLGVKKQQHQAIKLPFNPNKKQETKYLSALILAFISN